MTVRFEPEVTVNEAVQEGRDDSLFGMWREQAESADVRAYARKLRAPRF